LLHIAVTKFTTALCAHTQTKKISELEKLRGQDHMYFTDGSYAQGILEAIAHYQWL
jgi:hypothetical protein